MSVTATFTRLARADLGELVEAANDEDPAAFMAYLAANGTSVADYDWDGDTLEVLLPVLSEEYDIDLETSENEVVADIAEAMEEAMVFILTAEDKAKYLELLSPENFTKKALRQAYEDFVEEDEEDAGDMMLDGIVALHTALQEVDADHVVVVAVG